MGLSSRRRFLQSTGAAVAAPFILPSKVWSAEVKPNDRITMGFIGMGKQNRGLLNRFMGDKRVQAVAVCEVDTNRREAAKEQVHGAKRNLYQPPQKRNFPQRPAAQLAEALKNQGK